MSLYDYYTDERDCDSCEGVETVTVEGCNAEASGQCRNCGETNWVYRAEELDSDAAEAAGDAWRDER